VSIKQHGGVFGRNPTFNDVTVEGDITVDGTAIPDPSTILVDADIGTIASQDADSVNIDGGAIDGVTIGGSSAGEGTFTTLTGTGTTNIKNAVFDGFANNTASLSINQTDYAMLVDKASTLAKY